MKITIDLYQFRDAFHRLDRWNFSDAALDVLFDYFDEYEKGTDQEIELDVVAICCDFAENTPKGIAEDYEIDLPDTEGIDEDEADEAIADTVREYLEDEGVFVGDAGGTFVYRQF